MPTPQLEAIARKHGISTGQAEAFWAQARKEYGDDYVAVVGTVKKMAARAERARRSKLQ